MIVSVHLPKTAGTSFATALEVRFGSNLQRDYADLPINTPPFERNAAALRASLANGANDLPGVECIHGHFLPLKYLLLATRRELTFVTWMRHPVDRLVSHYHFWRRSYDPAAAPRLQRRMMDEDWSLERFGLGEEVRNLYDQFLWGFPLSRFDFIGVTEYFAADLAEFAHRYLGTPVAAERLNAGEAADRRIDPALRQRLEVRHAADMELYRRALAMRETRRVIS